MNGQIREYLANYPEEISALFFRLRKLIFESTPDEPEEKLWAKLPSYYSGEAFVRLIPFRDHINIEAQAVLRHREELTEYKITPKGMLQIYLKQQIPEAVLLRIFADTLSDSSSGS